MGVPKIHPELTHVAGAAEDLEAWGDSPENRARIEACLRILAAEPDVDLSRVALMGTSRGALAAIGGAAAAGDRIRALWVISGGVVEDGEVFDASFPRRADVATLRAPTFIVHGSLDTVVLPARSERLADALTQLGVAVRREVYPVAMPAAHSRHLDQPPGSMAKLAPGTSGPAGRRGERSLTTRTSSPGRPGKTADPKKKKCSRRCGGLRWHHERCRSGFSVPEGWGRRAPGKLWAHPGAGAGAAFASRRAGSFLYRRGPSWISSPAKPSGANASSSTPLARPAQKRNAMTCRYSSALSTRFPHMPISSTRPADLSIPSPFFDTFAEHLISPCKGRIYDPACGSGGNPRHSESWSEAETASRRLHAGRAQRGNFGESHGGGAKCEVGSASVEVKILRPFGIQNSSFVIRSADLGKEHADTFRRQSSAKFVPGVVLGIWQHLC